MTESYIGNDVLDLFSTYAVNRNNFIAKLITKYISQESAAQKKILEFGAGKGEFINRYTAHETYAVDADPEYRKTLSLKHKTFTEIENVPGEVDFIFLIDVLEHVSDDQQYLGRMHQKLKSGSGIFIYVPARQELYSGFDKKIGHHRRYGKKELERKMIKAGFNIVASRYHEFLGYVASFIHNKIFKKEIPTPSSVKAYDRFLVPATNFFEGIMPPPIGKSLYIYARKQA